MIDIQVSLKEVNQSRSNLISAENLLKVPSIKNQVNSKIQGFFTQKLSTEKTPFNKPLWFEEKIQLSVIQKHN